MSGQEGSSTRSGQGRGTGLFWDVGSQVDRVVGDQWYNQIVFLSSVHECEYGIRKENIRKIVIRGKK